MAITAGICNDYIRRMAVKEVDHTAGTGDVFKFYLLTEAANRDQDDTAYSATGESSGTNYTAGGATVASVTPALAGSPGQGLRKLLFDWANPSWLNVTIASIRGGQMYNDTVSNASIFNSDFGADNSATAANVTVLMPEPTDTTAIIRL